MNNVILIILTAFFMYSCNNKKASTILSVEESKKMTKSFYGDTINVDLSYITEELMTEKYEPLTSESLNQINSFCGYYEYYCWQNGEYCYCFKGGSNANCATPCGNSNWYLPFSKWNHNAASNQNCIGHQLIYFTRRQ